MSHAFSEVYRPLPEQPSQGRVRRASLWQFLVRLALAVLVAGGLLGGLCAGTAAIVLHWSAERHDAALQEVHLQGLSLGLSMCAGGVR